MHLSHNSHGVHDDTLIIHGVEALEVNISGLRININDGDVGAKVVSGRSSWPSGYDRRFSRRMLRSSGAPSISHLP